MSGLSAEDRARLEGLLDYLQRTEDHPQAKADVDVFARALALIDQQEKDYRNLQDDYFDQKQMRKDFANEADDLRERRDQQEKALEAADELAKRVLAHDTDDRFTCGYCEKQARAYRSARATSTKEDG